MNIYEFMMALGLTGSIEDLPNMDLSTESKEESKMREMDVWNFLEKERNLKQENETLKHENKDLDSKVVASQDLNRQLKEEMEAIKSKLKNQKALEERVKDYEARLYDLNTENEKLKDMNTSLNGLLSEKNKHINELEKQLEECGERCLKETTEENDYIPGLVIETENVFLTINN